MQNVSDDEGKHIITASNVNKRLSFRGREKFVEVFSQGRNNYRWAELSQIIAPPVDQAISWSSSEDEGDEAASQVQRGRHLPNRTLTSQINFDDCKLVRRRGHRHSSAQFVRSIEKRPRERPGNYNDSSLALNITETKTSKNSINVPDATFHKGCSVSGVESTEEHIWEKNLSLLNQTVNLSPDCSADQNLDQSHQSPKETKAASEIEPTSPILVTRVNRIRRKRSTVKKESKPEEKSDAVCGSKEVPSSPVFKTSRPKRGRVRKINPSKLEKESTNFGQPEELVSPVKSEFLNNVTSEETVGRATNVDPTAPPKDSNKCGEPPVSPVIGRTIKRKKRMIVEKEMSPILGCKYGRPPKKLPKVTCSLKSESVNEDFNGIDDSLFDEVNQSSANHTSLFNEAKLILDEEESELLASQSKATAKRSLDFSWKNHLNMNIDCDNSESLAEVSRQDQDNTLSNDICDSLNKSNCAQVIDNCSPAYELALNKSDLIEDANTEQIDVTCTLDKPVKSSFQQKKNKLSLRKKSPQKNYSAKKLTRPVIPLAQSKVSVFPETSSKNDTRMYPLRKNELAQHQTDTVQLPLCGKKDSNQTLCIEEDLSEPMEVTTPDIYPDVYGSPVPLHTDEAPQKKPVPFAPKLCAGKIDTSLTWNKPASDDAEIDSCSSSPDASQQQEIEGLPSSAVSTVVAISQMSSPPAPCNVGGLAAEISNDDFNAPPKKGKTKLKPDGPANRLQRLLNRQRSSSRIWQFKRSKQSKSAQACSDQSTSMLLAVTKTWTEYSHILVQGRVLNDGCQNRAIDALSEQVIVVLDPKTVEKLEKIMSCSKVRLFPPWQSLKLRGISVILCAYCIEVVPADCPSSKSKSQEERTENSTFLREECVSGASLCEIIFPNLKEIQMDHLIQYTEAVSQEPHESAENAENVVATAKGSISSLVSHHYLGGAISDILTLTILRAFQFRSLEIDAGESSDSPSWSLLGQDTFGEVCEVLLGCEKTQSLKEGIWEGVVTGQIIGKTYCFSGFLPTQRIAPFRVSNLWKIISSMGIQGLCDQPVFYVLSSANFQWSCSLSENQRITDLYRPTFSKLISILSETVSEPRRVNIFCSILHATKERLYITDIETSPSITVIAVNQTAYLPDLIYKAPVLVVLDLEVAVDELRIDKYSKVSSREDVSVSLNSNLINEELQRRLASLNPALPLLHRNTSSKTLAMFFGTVVGVDEESAYMWPACGICENELLSLGDGTECYRCEKCNDQCDNFIKHMSLQVLCTCPNLPLTSSIRIKLNQSTIELLLPQDLCNDEGYDMNSVIGQQLGPLRCEVLHSKDGNFILQELPKVK